MGWTYLVEVIDCCTREIVGWDLSRRCRTEEALAARKQAVLNRLPRGEPRGQLDADHRQRNAIHFDAFPAPFRARRMRGPAAVILHFSIHLPLRSRTSQLTARIGHPTSPQATAHRRFHRRPSQGGPELS